jgi:hypothetical protein
MLSVLPLGSNITNIRVHGSIDISTPQFYEANNPGFTHMHMNATNNENETQSFVIILQFQNEEGYVTQLVNTEPITVELSETMRSIVEYADEPGKRLFDIFVWTDLENPLPITRYRYIANIDNGTFMDIPISNDGIILLSQLLSECADSDYTCDEDSIRLLHIAYDQCLDYRAFEIEELNPICSDTRLNNYAA